jgi:hypothetical protein
MWSLTGGDSTYFGLSFYSDGSLRVSRRSTAETTTDTGWDGALNTLYHFVTVFNDSTTFTVYVNGKQIYSSSSLTAVTPDTNILNLLLGKLRSNAGGYEYQGEIYNCRVFNLALSAAEIKDLNSGAAVPYKYRGAKQVEKFADTGMDNWSGGNPSTFTKYNEGGSSVNQETTITRTGANSMRFDVVGGSSVGARDANAAALMVGGKMYRLIFYAKASTSGKSMGIRTSHSSVSGTIVVSTQSLTTSWAKKTVEFQCDKEDSGGNVIFFRHDSGTYSTYIDDVSFKQIGCIIELDGAGVTTNTWYDQSGNNYDGTVSGAVACCIPRSS